jgi:hypothetical protein
MPGIARVGDTYGPGGVLTSPVSPNVIVNGRPVALNAVAYTPHPCCGKIGCPPTHCGGTVPGMQALGFQVFVNGVPPVLKGDNGICGHAVRTASGDVKVGTGDGFAENPDFGTFDTLLEPELAFDGITNFDFG